MDKTYQGLKCPQCKKPIRHVVFKEYNKPAWSYCFNKRCKLYNVQHYIVEEQPEKENWLQKFLRRIV